MLAAEAEQAAGEDAGKFIATVCCGEGGRVAGVRHVGLRRETRALKESLPGAEAR